jgi:hypothetical protein
MKRLSPLLLVTLVFAGCHAPMPSFDLLAPYGSTRIPPPATNSVTMDKYYQPSGQTSTTAPIGTGFRARRPSTSLSADSSLKTSDVKPVRGSTRLSRATRATHETTDSATLVSASSVVELSEPIRIVERGTTPRTLSPSVRGMRINEATIEPGRFYPTRQAFDITQLPLASTLRYTTTVLDNQAVGSSVTTTSTSSRNSGRSETAAGTGWQSRN